MDIGSNPDPNQSERITWMSVWIRIQTQSEKNNLEYGSNPDPKTHTDRLVFTIQVLKIEPCLKWTLKRDTVRFYRKRSVLTRVVGIELNCALVVRQLSVELANGYHALSPVLRKGLSSRGQSVADDPLVQLLTCLNTKKCRINARFL